MTPLTIEIIGENGTGKTIFIQSMSTFEIFFTPGVCHAHIEKYRSKDGEVEISIHSDRSPLYHGSDAVILLFSLTDIGSLRALKEIANQLVEKDVPCVAFGTASDIATGVLNISVLEDTFPNAIPIYIGSGKTGLNVYNCLQNIIYRGEDKRHQRRRSSLEIKKEKVRELLSQLESLLLE